VSGIGEAIQDAIGSATGGFDQVPRIFLTVSTLKTVSESLMNRSSETTRRDLIAGGAAALAGASLLRASTAQAATPADKSAPWHERRAAVERAWLDLLGDFPQTIPALAPEMRKVTLEPGCPSERLSAGQLAVLKQQMAEEEGAIERFHVSFQTEADDRVTAWLLVPESARSQPAPAMICIHSTTKGSGKDQTAGLSGATPDSKPDTSEGGRSYGLHLARHGFVTLSIDLLTDGERVEPGEEVLQSAPFYQRHPEWSIVGKNTWDIMRSVDFLQTLDFVMPAQIGCIGLSLGGHTAVFAGAFEPRMAATISVGGVLDWHRPAEHWARAKGRYVYIKKFRPYVDDPTLPVPVDFDELMMLVAPRPLLILSSEWEFHNRRNLLDKCLDVAKVYRNWRDVEGLPSVLEARKARRSYQSTLSYYKERSNISPKKMEAELESIGAGDCFAWFTYPGGHSYPPVVRQFSMAWLDRWLDRDLRWYGKYGRE
jgi:dienelactone hydrolase